MPVTLTCEICGADFDVDPGRAGSARFCSMKCYVRYRSRVYRGAKVHN